MTGGRVGREGRPRDLTRIIRSHFGPENGVDLELPEREAAREPPSFEGGWDPCAWVRRQSAPGDRAFGALKGQR